MKRKPPRFQENGTDLLAAACFAAVHMRLREPGKGGVRKPLGARVLLCRSRAAGVPAGLLLLLELYQGKQLIRMLWVPVARAARARKGLAVTLASFSDT